MIEKVVQKAEQLKIAAVKLKRPALNITAEHKMLLEVCEMLKPFQEATTTLSGVKYPAASHIVPTVVGIHRALRKLETKSESGLKVKDCLLSEISTRLSSLENDLDCQISTFLDPRFTIRIFDNEQKEAVTKGFSVLCGPAESDPVPPKRACTSESIYELSDSSPEDDDNMEGSALHSELKMYAAKKREPLDTCPLAYWKNCKDALPLLAQL
ncbi:UNVERIFIED_CONTAM: hypothetical protein FKN15_078149 [Acipenser sinensis]